MEPTESDTTDESLTLKEYFQRIVDTTPDRREAVCAVLTVATGFMEVHTFASFDDEYPSPADAAETHHLNALFDRVLELCALAVTIGRDGRPNTGWTVLEGAVHCHRELARVIDRYRIAAEAVDEANAREQIAPAADEFASSLFRAGEPESEPGELAVAAARAHHHDSPADDTVTGPVAARILVTTRARQVRTHELFLDEETQLTLLADSALRLAAGSAQAMGAHFADWDAGAIDNLDRCLQHAVEWLEPAGV